MYEAELVMVAGNDRIPPHDDDLLAVGPPWAPNYQRHKW